MEGLAASLGMGEGPHDELEALPDLRNSKYEGVESVDEPTLADALRLAKHILTIVSAWRQRHHPDLIAAS
ncbi:hypothetical protein [Burkholderia plantarii]|uniref:hypothetical protein n=1 Tax=Burkholderia plantarii TaxID=41899 RepID=UPI0018DEC9AB|nr:hypothetical protein [Burkholderia plantarii]MBI0330471.1 hypothetical protein [Burkholderia plantarii]